MFGKSASIRAGLMTMLAMAAVAVASPARGAQHGSAGHAEAGHAEAGHAGADTAVVGRVAGEGTNFEHIIHMAGQQRMRSQAIANEVLLIALGHEIERSLRALESSRATFDSTLSALRRGDAGMNLPPASDPAVLESLDRAEALWREMDAVLRAGPALGTVSDDQIARIADVSASLRSASNDTVDAYLELLRAGRLHSMLTVAVDSSTRQQMLSQQMTSNFLLIAYGHDEDFYRRDMADAIARFDRTMAGLIDGDLEHLLLPAPTPQIKSQLQRVARIWRDEFEPLMREAMIGGPMSAESIAEVARLNRQLMHEMEPAVEWYHML